MCIIIHFSKKQLLSLVKAIKCLVFSIYKQTNKCFLYFFQARSSTGSPLSQYLYGAGPPSTPGGTSGPGSSPLHTPGSGGPSAPPTTGGGPHDTLGSPPPAHVGKFKNHVERMEGCHLKIVIPIAIGIKDTKIISWL